MSKLGTGFSGALVALAAAAFVAAPAAAQDLDGRWLAFLGCWEPVGESVDGGMLCVQPVDDGVELFTVVDGAVTTSDVLVAGGGRLERSMEGCAGWESADFSADGRRVFTRSEFVCGEEVPRGATGIMSVMSPTRWMDVRSVDADGESMAWVQQYRLVSPDELVEHGLDDVTAGMGMAVRTARMAAARTIRAADVLEALDAVDTKAVEAWVAARAEPFDLDAEELIRLDDAGVPSSVIDVMVAVSYPDRFAIDEPEEGALGAGARVADRGRRGYDDRDCYGARYGFGVRSLYWNPFYYGYGYGYDSCRPYYSPYSYGYGYGFRNWGYGSGYYPTTIVITPRSPESRARVINGRGYTRGTSGSAGPRATSGGGAGGARVTPSGATNQGGASSSGGSSTGRKAKPRGGR